MALQLLVHGAGNEQPLVVACEDEDTIANVKEKIRAAGWPDGRQLLALTTAGGDQELSDEAKVRDLRFEAGSRIVAHHCRELRVTVEYNGASPHHEFRPSATVENVLRWALKQFGIDDRELGDFQLAYGNPPRTAPLDTPLGDLPADDCRITFALQREHFPQG